MIRWLNADSDSGPLSSRVRGVCLAVLVASIAFMAVTDTALAQVAPTAAEKAADRDRARSAKGPAFEVTYPAKLRKEAISARVYVFLGTGESKVEPRIGPDWFRPRPFFARDVKDWKPGETVRIDASADGFPGKLDSLAAGDYAIQAVIRLNPDEPKIGNGEGNAYGPVVHAKLEPDKTSSIALEVDRVVPPRSFRETDRIKLAEVSSPILSAFYHRPIKHRAAVILPTAPPGRKLPTVYIIPGFGGDHHMAAMIASGQRMSFGKDLVRVVLDPNCGTGHHVFADSATNGPRGKALVEEFIPYLEKTFPLVADSKARLVNGHSSGGWSSLWLQVTYPDVFGGTWSTSPDPVDFRDFQRIDIYAKGENMFRDREGKPRPIARMGALPAIYYDRFSKMEEVMGPGGQLGSFEAVFSPLDKEGKPGRLWDRATGAIDSEVARAWEPYDIRLVLERNWDTLGPKLKGKLHVITGGMDTFYLEGAVQLLKDSLAKRGSDAVIEIIPGRDHGSILDAKLAQRIDDEMKAAVAQFLEK